MKVHACFVVNIPLSQPLNRGAARQSLLHVLVIINLHRCGQIPHQKKREKKQQLQQQQIHRDDL